MNNPEWTENNKRLRMDDFVREFSVKRYTDRDCEVPVLYEWCEKIAPIESLLDIGAHYSASTYAAYIRKIAKKYDAIDIQDDSNVREIVDNYFIGNVNDYDFPQLYDVVICVSTIEHAGLSTYKANYKTERMNLFRKCLMLSKKHVWISFPVGQPFINPDEFANVTKYEFDEFENICKKSGWAFTERFFYTQGIPIGLPWREHKKREVALMIPVIEFIGGQSLCTMEIKKEVVP